MSDKGNPELVKAVISYKAQREKVKVRQRHELEDELFEWKADVGDEILVAREQGKSIATIAAIIGIQNRTFIYEMLSAANLRNGGEDKPRPEPEPEEAEDSAPYKIEMFDGAARVTFADGDAYELDIIDGRPDLPEEWGDHTKERRALYKQVIQEIKERL